MRVTNAMMMQNFLWDLQNINLNLLRSSEQVVTGRRISRPSDDPVGTSVSIGLRSELVSLTQFVENITIAQHRLEGADSKLNEVDFALTRVIQLIEQAASDTNLGTTRKNIAVEIQAITTQLLSSADTTVSGRYIFAGTLTTRTSLIAGSVPDNPDGRVYNVQSLTATGNGVTGSSITDYSTVTEHVYQVRFTDAAGAYEVLDLDSGATVQTGTLNGAAADFLAFDGLRIDYDVTGGFPATTDVWSISPNYTYNGTTDGLEIQVDESSTVVQNVTGAQAFGNTGNNLFDDLVALRQALLTDDSTVIRSSIDTIRARFDNITQTRASVGGRIAHMREFGESTSRRSLGLITQLSNVENVNIAEAITSLNQSQIALSAALQTGARLGQLSLFNFLG